MAKNVEKQLSIQMVSIVGDEVLMVKENVYGTIRYTLPKRMSLYNYEGHEELEARDLFLRLFGINMSLDDYKGEVETYNILYSDKSGANYDKEVKCFVFQSLYKPTVRLSKYDKTVVEAKYVKISEFLALCSFQNARLTMMHAIDLLDSLGSLQKANVISILDPNIHLTNLTEEFNKAKGIRFKIRKVLSNDDKNKEDYIKDIYDYFENMDFDLIIQTGEIGIHSLAYMLIDGCQVGGDYVKLFRNNGSLKAGLKLIFSLCVQRRNASEKHIGLRCLHYFITIIMVKMKWLSQEEIEEHFSEYFIPKDTELGGYSELRPVVNYDNVIATTYPELADESLKSAYGLLANATNSNLLDLMFTNLFND